MDQYKVQGEPLVLSLSQERVLCTAHQQEEETAVVTQTVLFNDLLCIWTLVDQIFLVLQLEGDRASGFKLEEGARLT